jgi:hypothetical protein
VTNTPERLNLMVRESGCEKVAAPKESVMIAVVAGALAVEFIVIGVVGLVA